MEIPESLPAAKEVQEKLRSKVIRSDQFGTIKYIAGVDVGFSEDYQISKAAVAVLSFPALQLLETSQVSSPTVFPYIPGFLSFREVPVILTALEQLTISPDIILCDGQGLAHPRRLGLACHLGIEIDKPTIGVAKTLFVGKHSALALQKGSWQPLEDQGEVIGAVVRSRTNVKPIYVSIGHKISLTSAIDYALRCTTKYRLPETTRIADKLSKS